MSFLNAKNLMIAYKKARKSRKEKQEVYLFEQQLEARLLKLLDDLKTKTYIHWDYKQIVLIDSKKRYIYSPVFRDHILHYMVYNEIYKVLDRRMVFSTFACRKWYGSHKAFKYLQKLILSESKKVWYENLFYLKLDFSKYFFSINHQLLKRKIFKHIKNPDLQYAINLIIDFEYSIHLYKVSNINEIQKIILFWFFKISKIIDNSV